MAGLLPKSPGLGVGAVVRERSGRAIRPAAEREKHYNLKERFCCRYAADAAASRSFTQHFVVAGGRWNRTDDLSAKAWDIQFRP